ncbi:MAG: proline--tRNA ligase [Candidatus Fermentibacteraceae bacterium]|nr:proline--tRNA ligase [Candidatus Fermentibacteraceae bacterium]MBN2608125.1 proline--tRNA ligase [Candidatus Fermentibacteraceae bacterium]
MAKNITSPAEDFSRWYQDVIREAELSDAAPVRGCMIIRPYGYAIWERIQASLDASFKETGHKNAYFPLLIPESFITREAQHVEGFAPELAVVTHGGGKKLDEPLVVRPTSETIINYMFSKWINSYRDLPMLLNQWANVVRWEMRPRAFLRTTEFLWQEGHTAHASEEEAREETLRMLRIYADFAENVAAIPVIPGRKTEREKFAGAVDSYTIEAMMGNGWALQSGTSHYLGTNFARVFDTTYLDSNNEQQYVHQTSWGVSTRLVGGVIMVHGDENGLRLPPKLAPVQVVIVPIARNESDRTRVMEVVDRLKVGLKQKGVRLEVDDSEGSSPGFKFNYWEVRGVPLRLEIGQRDLEEGRVMASPRNAPGREGKFTIPLDSLEKEIPDILERIQDEMLEEAKERMRSRTYSVDTLEEFREAITERPGFYSVWWDGGPEEEIALQQDTKATVRCIPLEQPEQTGKCIMTGRKTGNRVILARAY